MNNKQRLEAIKKDLEKRIELMRKSAENTAQFGQCGISFAGLAEIYEYILVTHFGIPCANCGKKCIPAENANGRCEKCQERYDEGIG